MKRFLLLIIFVFLLTACAKNDVSDVVKKFSDDVSKSDSYHLTGKMSIISDEEEFNYTFDVKYLKGDYYKVALLNTNNTHEQIILKNNDGVYVITPELNKSFKFQSSWPNNSSQSYLLSSLLKDINNDDKVKLKSEKDSYIITALVNYPNNSELIKEDIIFDKDVNIKKVIVYDNDNNKRIITEFTKVDLKANTSSDEFKLDQYVKQSESSNDKVNCNSADCEKTTANLIDDIIYPLYLPNNTYLTSSEKIGDGDRVILTFNGDRDFTIIEEAATISNNFEIKPVYGDPVMLNDVIGVMGDNSVRWFRGGINYYLTSSNLTGDEMSTIASSMNHAISVLGSK